MTVSKAGIEKEKNQRSKLICKDCANFDPRKDSDSICWRDKTPKINNCCGWYE
jgi:hypothetical protein